MVSQNQALATADALTLMLYSQQGIATALEELAGWISSQSGVIGAESALAVLQVLDFNAQALTYAINQLRQA